MRLVARSLRHPWRSLRAGVHYVAERPPVAVAIALGATVVAMASVCVQVYFHSQESARFAAERTARQTVAEKVIPPLCGLVWTQVHPVAGTQVTGRLKQNEAAWHNFGALFGCPNGIEPK